MWKVKDHQNIATLLGMSERRLYLQCETFRLDMFNDTEENECHNLEELLQVCDDHPVETWQHLPHHIVEQSLSGLQYLHSLNIAHRDIKPSNILVSNQFSMCNWKSNPILVKLTDFGLSHCKIRTETQKAQKVAGTRRVNCGTPGYISPECLNKDILFIGEKEMIAADVWSFGLTIYGVINADRTNPYENNEDMSEIGDWEKKVNEVICKCKPPTPSSKYKHLHQSIWITLAKLVDTCVVRCEDRPSSNDLSTNPCSYESSVHHYPLKVHQGSLLEEKHAILATALACDPNSDIQFNNDQINEDDATSACTFLSLKNCETLLELIETNFDMEKLIKAVNDTITYLMQDVNQLRSLNTLYSFDEAYTILNSAHLIKPLCLEGVSRQAELFSPEGVEDLDHVLKTEGV